MKSILAGVRHAVPFLLIALLLSFFSVYAQDSTTGSLTVDASQLQGTISPYVYGVNYGPWGMVSIDMQEEAAASGVTYFRFPAGRWGDLYDIREQQLDLFMLQARAWNAEPSISVRLEGGSPEQAAELVRYANIEKGYNVRYWSIGNEPDLFPDYTIERLNEEWRAIALAMLEVDPNILLIGPEVSQFPDTVEGTEYNNVRREWVREFLEVNGDLVDIVAVHRYPFPVGFNAPATTIDQLRDNAAQWDVLIENLRQVIVEAVGTELPMGFTEVNSDWSKPIEGEASPDSHFNAVWWADVLGRMIRQRVEIVNYFAFSSFGDTGAYGILDRYATRPTYYVYQLYQHFGSELVASASTVQHVSITAALADDNTLTLMIVNMNDESQSVPLTIDGVQISGDSEVIILDPDRQAETLAPLAITSGAAIDLPAQSVMLLRIPITQN